MPRAAAKARQKETQIKSPIAKRIPALGLGFLGFGTVGAATYSLLQRNRKVIEYRAGVSLRTRKVAVRDLTRKRGVSLPSAMLTTNPREVVDDSQVQIVIEVMGGVHPARELILGAIKNGKSVVTCNKELLAKHGSEILDAAMAHHVDVNFEGSVGGGIPIIQPLKQQLVGNRIRKLTGIVNGTTNYILTRMTREHREFGEVLREAQTLGFAEADPTSDVDGFDAAYKLCILASIAFGHRVSVDQVRRQGIREVTTSDIAYAAELGYVIKLLAVAAEDSKGCMEMRVQPAFLPADHPLATVSDAFNAILVEGDAVGPVMFFGRGAGGNPTASAVVGDIIEIARNIRSDSVGRIACLCDDQAKFKPWQEFQARYYLRTTVLDRPGVIAQIAGVLGRSLVSIASVVQKHTTDGQAEIVWVTHAARQRQIDSSLNGIRSLKAVKKVNSVIRVEEEE